MPKWLDDHAPTLTLWVCALAPCLVAAFSPDGLPAQTELATRVAFPLAVSTWVLADARKRGRRVFYDYGTFLFFAWPIVAPVYLFQTRGFRAFLTLLGFVGIWLVAVVQVLREFVF